MLNCDLSPAAPQGGRESPQEKPVWCPRAGGSRQTGSPAGHCNHPLSRSSQTLLLPSDFLVDGQVSGLGTVHPLLTINFFSTWILPLHVVSSTLNRKSSSSIIDGLKRRTYICVCAFFPDGDRA